MEPTEASPKTLRKRLSIQFGSVAGSIRGMTDYLHKDFRETGRDNHDHPSQGTDIPSPKKSPKTHSLRQSLMSSVRRRKGLSFQGSHKTNEFGYEPTEPPPTSTSSRMSLYKHIPKSLAKDGDTGKLSSHGVIRTTRDNQPSTQQAEIQRSGSTTFMGAEAYLEDPFIQYNVSESVCCKPSSGMVEDDQGYMADSESDTEDYDKDPLAQEPNDGAPRSAEGVRFAMNSMVTPTLSVHFEKPTVPSPNVDALPFRLKAEMNPLCSDHHKQRSVSEKAEVDIQDFEQSQEITPSMGSRIIFDEIRADRSRRYQATVELDRELEGDLTGKSCLDESTMTRPLPGAHDQTEKVIDQECIDETPLCQTGDSCDRASSEDLKGQHFQDVMFLRRDFERSVPTITPLIGESPYLDESVYPDNARRHSHQGVRTFAGEENSRPSSLEVEAESLRSSTALLSQCSIIQDTPASQTKAQNFQDTQGLPSPAAPSTPSRLASYVSDVTSESCAVTTRSPACYVPCPFPGLHGRSEPARPLSNVEDWMTKQEEFPLRRSATANVGLGSPLPISAGPSELRTASNIVASSSSPSSLSREIPIKNIGRSQKLKETPTKIFPQEVSPEVEGENVSPQSIAMRPRFAIKQFEPYNEPSSPYVGHELEAISGNVASTPDTPGRATSNNDTKKASTTGKSGVTSGDVTTLDSPSPLSRKASRAKLKEARKTVVQKRKVERKASRTKLKAARETVLQKEKVENVGSLGGLSPTNAGCNPLAERDNGEAKFPGNEAHSAEKPRWQVVGVPPNIATP